MSRKEMYAAVSSGDLEAISRILTEQPDMINQSSWMGPWLNVAAANNHVPALELLVRNGLDVNGDGSADHALGVAASKGAMDAAGWLLENGARVDGHPEKSPPLSDAIIQGSIAMVRLLLQHGASLDKTWGHFNYSPITFAQTFGADRAKILALLEQASDGSAPTEAAPEVNAADLVDQHLQQHYGPLETLSLQQIVTDLPIRVHVIKLEHCTLLATSGMSAKPMTVPKGSEDWQFAELLMYLPPNWPLDEAALEDPKTAWPLEWMFRIAHFPHEQNTFIGYESAVFSNEEPPEPFADNTRLSCLLAARTPGEEGVINIPGGYILFYSLYPIYTEERDLHRQQGQEALFEKFQAFRIPLNVTLDRPNVVTSREPSN